MDQTLLVAEQLDIGMKFLEVVEKHLTVAAAVWIKRQDTKDWWLYVVTPDLESEHLSKVRLKLSRAKREFRNRWLNSCHLELARLDDPVATESLEIKNLYPDEKVIPHPDCYLAKMGVENVYIYGDAALPHRVTAS